MATLAPASTSPLLPIIPNAPVVVEWSDVASRPRTPRYLAGPEPCSVQLNLLFNEEQGTVSFKIRVWLYFEQASGGERQEYVYICIHPENVHLLLQCPTHSLPKGSAAAVRSPTAYFRLVLSRPVSILAPLDAPIPLRSERSSRLLDSLEELSRQTVLGIHLGQHTISDSDLVRRICDAFTNGSIKQHPRHDSLRDFYRGRGAGVVQQFSGFARSGGEDTGMRSGKDRVDGNGSYGASPPPYPEARELPPPTLFAQQKKRQRSPEDTVAPLKKRQLSSENPDTIHESFSNVCAELLSQQKAQMTELISWQQAETAKFVEQQKAQMTEFISWQQAQMTKFVEQQQAVLARVDRAEQCMESRIIERVEEHLCDESYRTADQGSRSQEWEQLIQKLVDKGIVDLEAAMESSLERGKENLKCELKDECIDELKDVLEDGLVSITLPR